MSLLDKKEHVNKNLQTHTKEGKVTGLKEPLSSGHKIGPGTSSFLLIPVIVSHKITIHKHTHVEKRKVLYSRNSGNIKNRLHLSQGLG